MPCRQVSASAAPSERPEKPNGRFEWLPFLQLAESQNIAESAMPIEGMLLLKK
jgi:hypothetical protein